MDEGFPVGAALVMHAVDKSRFGHGPWHDEPDMVSWAEDGMRCRVVRQNDGTFKGLVQLPADCEWARTALAYGERFIPDRVIDVHGGFRGFRLLDGRTWVTFACVRSTDWFPIPDGPEHRAPWPQGVHRYRSAAFFVNECRRVAQQVARFMDERRADAVA